LKLIIILAASLSLASVWADEAAPSVVSSGQPSPAELEAKAEGGFVTIIDLRTEKEPRGFDEVQVVESLGMRYESLPIANAGDLNEENAERLGNLIDASDGPVLVHCASGNRVGALFAVLRRLEGYSVEESIAYGRNLGMRSLEPAVLQRLPQIEPEEKLAASEESEQ